MKKLFRNPVKEGKEFERQFEIVSTHYNYQRILKLAKCDPPSVIVRGQIIYKANPFLDWVGSWTERGGRSLFIETKSTEHPRLPMSDNHHLTKLQIDNLKFWAYAGAAVGVVWEWRGHGCVFLPIGLIKKIWDEERRHIKFEEGDPIAQGNGMILFDFVHNLRRWYPGDSIAL